MATVIRTEKRQRTAFGKLIKWLFIGFMVVFVAAIANIWLQMPALMLTVSTLAVLIFSAFILYDLQRVVNGGETNYVTATLSVYLSVPGPAPKAAPVPSAMPATCEPCCTTSRGLASPSAV